MAVSFANRFLLFLQMPIILLLVSCSSTEKGIPCQDDINCPLGMICNNSGFCQLIGDCVPASPPVEVCDGVDNDCDGETDEGIDLDKDPQNCGLCGNQCQFANAQEVCLNGICQIESCKENFKDLNHWNSDGCEYQCTISGKEICDDLDNDCDGKTDEHLESPACQLKKGVCKGSFKTCGGKEGWLDCRKDNYGDLYQPQEISCDGRDNDCNGLVDEKFDLTSDPANCGFCGRTCQFKNAVGHCLGGFCLVKECKQGYFDLDGNPATDCQKCEQKNQGLEICNGSDDDCDGLVDEGFDLASDANHCGFCGHICQFKQARSECRAGECALSGCFPGWIDLNQKPKDGCEYSCSLSKDGAEICNGKDDDCDGKTDEELSVPAASKNRGVCKGEKKSCGGEQGWLDPDYSSLAGFENIEKSCDGLDNDCDGNTDNPPFDLDNDLANCGQCGKNCRTDNAEPYCLMGVCSIKSCLPGWCDLDQSAANGCEHANVSTQNGKEICDQKDNDCDGLVDEDFDLQQDPENCSECDKKCSFDNAAAACLKGQCQLLWCQDYYFDHNQNAADGCEIGPCLDEGELCDGQDNDCDGVTDEELQSKQCPLFKGVCRGITRQCGGQNGWDSCSDQDYGPDFQAQETSCDGLDNDCDGLVDEMILEGDPDQDCSCFVESAVNGLQQAYAIIGIPFSLAVTPDLGLQIFTDSQTGSIISRPIYPEAGRKPLQRDRKISLSLTQVSLGRQRSYVGV